MFTVGENEVSTVQTDVFTLEIMKKGSSPDGGENEIGYGKRLSQRGLGYKIKGTERGE